MPTRKKIVDRDVPLKRASKYHICDDCAADKGWTGPEWAVTVISGLCGHCEREDETMLTPTLDFSGPGKTAIWD